MAESYRGVPIEEISDALGPNVAISQVTLMLMEEGVACGRALDALRDLLVRSLREVLPEGWQTSDERLRMSVISAITLLVADLGPFVEDEAVVPAIQGLFSAISQGWRPELEDRIIADLAARILKPDIR